MRSSWGCNLGSSSTKCFPFHLAPMRSTLSINVSFCISFLFASLPGSSSDRLDTHSRIWRFPDVQRTFCCAVHCFLPTDGFSFHLFIYLFIYSVIHFILLLWTKIFNNNLVMRCQLFAALLQPSPQQNCSHLPLQPNWTRLNLLLSQEHGWEFETWSWVSRGEKKQKARKCFIPIVSF